MARFHRRLAAVVVLTATALLALTAPSGAVLSGENGRIVFISGRADNNDATARVHLLPVPFSSGGGTVGPSITPLATQHRHPTWSPDRTKIAYARGTAQGDPTLQDFDIFIQDLTTTPNTITPLTNTGDSLSEDRPAWSPDGTRIVYEHQPADPGNDSADRDIRVQTVNGAGAAVRCTGGPGRHHLLRGQAGLDARFPDRLLRQGRRGRPRRGQGTRQQFSRSDDRARRRGLGSVPALDLSGRHEDVLHEPVDSGDHLDRRRA